MTREEFRAKIEVGQTIHHGAYAFQKTEEGYQLSYPKFKNPQVSTFKTYVYFGSFWKCAKYYLQELHQYLSDEEIDKLNAEEGVKENDSGERAHMQSMWQK